MIYLIGIVTLFNSFLFSSSFAKKVSVEELLNDKASVEWSNLLHYGPRLFKGVKSLADGDDFFLAKEGKTNPSKELSATIRLFSSRSAKVGKFKLHPQCAFPARRLFLKKYKFDYGKDIKCPEYEGWKSSLDASSLSVVFSTSYPNNPSSLFGHTFLKIGKTTKSNLFDYTAAFSALVVQKDWGPKYVYKGLTGGYPGFFDITPYYQKVNEYSDVESRDLYEYKLNIPKERIDVFMAHLWELYATTYFDYFFVDENCSYLLGEALKVAMPNWNLEPLRSTFYLPSDLIRIIKRNKNAIKEVSFRPSNSRRLKNLYKALSNQKINKIKQIASGEEFDFSELDAPTLDGVIEFFKFKTFANEGVTTKEDQSKYRVALLERSKKVSTTNLSSIYDLNNQPEKGHLPSKIYLTREVSDQVSNLGVKLGFHDLLSQDIGLEPFSQFEFLDTEIRYSDDSFSLKKVKIVDIISLHPHSFYDSQWSWKAKFSNELLSEQYCIDCNGVVLNAAIGKTFNVGEESIFYSLVTAGVVATKKYSKGYELNSGIELSYLKNFNDKYKLQLKYELISDYNLNIKKDYYSKLEFNNSFFINKSYNLRILSAISSDRASLRLNSTKLALQIGTYF